MGIVVFLRGVNVGGHKRFRPTVVAGELAAYEVVNIGAAGTFVVRKPGTRERFEAVLRKKLPFETAIITCDDRDVLRLVDEDPFAAAPAGPDVTRFVTVLRAGSVATPSTPVFLPTEADWLVQIIGVSGRFVLGVYRRHMKTIGYLGKVDSLFGVDGTTRNWNTISAIARVLRGEERRPDPINPPLAD
jgi:uncharacterized protein (DUF1697 family)